MKNITQQFNSGFEPYKALLIYRYDKAEEINQFGRDEKRTEIYVESYDIGTNGKPINAHPLNEKEVSALSDLLQTTQETKSSYLKSKWLLPSNMEDFTKTWEQYFFNSNFSHSISGNNSTKTNTTELWRSLAGKDEPFPQNELIKTSLTLKTIIQ
jgi:hypothetical protein